MWTHKFKDNSLDDIMYRMYITEMSKTVRRGCQHRRGDEEMGEVRKHKIEVMCHSAAEAFGGGGRLLWSTGHQSSRKQA